MPKTNAGWTNTKPENGEAGINMAMVMLFMVEQRLLYKNQYPLLICFDIAVLLFFLPNRAITFKEVIKQMKIRHKKRRDSIEFAFRKQIESEYAIASL